MRVVPSNVSKDLVTRAANAVAIVALAVAWAGTHLLGQAFAVRSEFPASLWGLGLGLIAAAGLLTGSLLRPINVKADFDWRRAMRIMAAPLFILVYTYVSLEFGIEWVFLHRLAAWAMPYGQSALAFMIGIGAAAGMSVQR